VVCVGSSEDSAEQAEILGTRDKGASLVLDTREKDKGKGHKVKSKHDKKKGKKKKARKKEKRKAKKAKKRLKKHKNKRKCIQLSSSTSSSSSDSSSSEACPRDVALDFETFLERGDVLLAQHLIRRRGSEWRSASGDGPLHMATRKNRPELVAWLLESGGAGAGAGGVDMRNFRGETPLLVAARLFRGAVALQLVEAMADPGATDFSGEAPEAFDLDGLLLEAERDVQASRRSEQERMLAAVAAARRAREEAEWRERLFCETGLEDNSCDPFAGYEDLEHDDTERNGRDWIDDVAEEVEERRRREAHRRAEERIRARERVRKEAESWASKQEERARKAAASADAEYRRQRAAAGDQPAGSRTGDRGSADASSLGDLTGDEARLAARAADETRWQAFEQGLASASSVKSAAVPWPTGPVDNPLRIDPAGHPTVVKSQIRAALLRWHPDKFAQRVGALMQEGPPREGALQRASGIAQQLNRLLASLGGGGGGGGSAGGAAGGASG